MSSMTKAQIEALAADWAAKCAEFAEDAACMKAALEAIAYQPGIGNVLMARRALQKQNEREARRNG